jgi:2-iminobutanoate/2-iminopropanoate deaminase
MTADDMIIYIATDCAPHPQGHYSQASIYGSLIFISGQLPLSRDGTPQTGLDFGQQTRLAMDHLITIAAAGGGSKEQILQVRAYIVGVEHWPEFNRLYAEIFGPVRPARAVVPVPALHHGCLIELEAVAAKHS